MRVMVDEVSAPATAGERAAAAVTAISFYFIGEGIPALQDREAAIWLTELKDFPAWAIDHAVSAWVGRETPAKKRCRKPLPGDIADLAAQAMASVYQCKTKLDWWDKYQGAYPSYIERTAAR